jgi:hypothetical protein
MSSYAPSPALRKLFSEIEQLLQTETEAHVSAGVRAAGRIQAEHLNQSVRRLRQADGFAEIAAILGDACAPFCNDCAVFRVDNNVVTGERGRARQHREVRFTAPEAAAFAGAIESREPVVTICSVGEISATLVNLFGHAADDKAHLFPLTVDGSVLGNVLRIEPAPPVPSVWDSLSPEDRGLHLRAQRYARVQVAEMRLYRPEAVKAGRARGSVFGLARTNR